LTDVDAWHEHIPFAFLAVELLQPRILVELGVQRGDLYCAFCQAVERLALETRCYGVDTWRGDSPAGWYEDDVLTELRAYHDAIYGRFSRLVQSTFDEAVEYFRDRSVDLLHMDGLHTYEAARHDFETWQPKLSDKAVLFLHDINVRERGFGVWRFWAEVSENRPSLALPHGKGLGLVALGSNVPRSFVEFLLAAVDPHDPTARLLNSLGNRVALVGRMARAKAGAAAAEQERAHLATRLGQLEGELATLLRELPSRQTDLEQLRLDLERRTVEVAAASDDLQRTRYDVAKRDEELEPLRSELPQSATQLHAAVHRLDNALHGPRGELHALRAELAKLSCQLHEVGQRQHLVMHQVHGLSARLAVLESAPGFRRFLRNTRRAFLRRRFEFDPRPAKELVRFGAEGDVWESVGCDPSFELVSRRGFAPTGWVLLDFELETDIRCSTPPFLYIDRGEGYSDASCIHLPWPSDGRITAVVNLLAVVSGLRFDPLDRPGPFRLGRLVLREVGRPEMGIRLVGLRVLELLRTPRRIPAGLGAVIAVVRAGGMQEVKNRLVGKTNGDEAVRYADWVEHFDALREADRSAITRAVELLPRRPLLSIVMPVYNTPRRWLERAIESVRSQLYPDWELCIGEDASTKPHVRRVLDAYAHQDPRIKVVYRERNGHISEASNSSLAVATGDFIVLMDSDDELPAHALYMVAEELNAHPETDLLYSDEDKIDERGQRYSPYFKPDWNPDLFFSQNYFSHLGVYRTALVRAVGGFRKAFDGSQDYDLAIRCVARTRPERVRHIPHVLYHWRAINGSGAVDAHAKSYAQPAAERALRDHLEAVDPRIEVSVAAFPTTYRVRYPLPAERPLVSLIIPTRDGRAVLERCVESILAKTTYPRFEILIIDNQSRDPATLEYLEALTKDGHVRVVRYDRPFNYSAVNNLGVRTASGTVVGLLNNDVEIVTADWLAEMASHALRPEIGCVGAKLLYPNDTLQHAGIVTGLLTLAGHIHRYLPRDAAGYFCRAAMVHDVSAVTGACMVLRREVFEEVGGLDENLAIAFNDVDFCLRVEAAGYRNLWTPYAELYHHESLSRGAEDTPEKRARFQGEIDYMRQRWGARLEDDRWYSPNLSLANENVEIAWPPRGRRPWEYLGTATWEGRRYGRDHPPGRERAKSATKEVDVQASASRR
jgi:GT2 family glycosyltransferase